MGETTFFSGRDEQVKFLGEVLRHGFSACVYYGQGRRTDFIADFESLQAWCRETSFGPESFVGYFFGQERFGEVAERLGDGVCFDQLPSYVGLIDR